MGGLIGIISDAHGGRLRGPVAVAVEVRAASEPARRVLPATKEVALHPLGVLVQVQLSIEHRLARLRNDP